MQGDTREFAVFVDQNKNLVTSIAYSAIGDLSGSEDIAQETFLAAWQARQELRDPNKLVSWLSSIARNLAKQWVRNELLSHGLPLTWIRPTSREMHPIPRNAWCPMKRSNWCGVRWKRFPMTIAK